VSVARAFLIVITSGVGFGTGGGGLGYVLGTTAPSYYRSVFRNGNDPTFNPVEVGLGLGVTQGVVAGVVVGCIIVLAVAWYQSRRRGETNKDNV
jgi:hypothetical protein